VIDYGSEGERQKNLIFTSWYQGGWYFFTPIRNGCSLQVSRVVHHLESPNFI